MRQMWKCGCGTERQWGAVAIGIARKAAREVNQSLSEAPVLYCETCKENTRHTFGRDAFFGEGQAIEASAESR